MGALHFFENVGCLGRPDKRFGIGVVAIDVIADSRDQLLDIAEDSTAEPVLSGVAEESFHHVEPRAARGREVDMEARMLRQMIGDN